MSEISENLAVVRQKIAAAAKKAGRDAASVELMAVTKTRTRAEADTAIKAGVTLLGENRVQEAAQKYGNSPPACRLHLIGHLQRNKAKFVPGLFDCVESIDKIETAVTLHDKCLARDNEVDILLEYNTSGEESKSGFVENELLFEAVEKIASLPRLHLRGLMTIGPLTDNVDDIRRAFVRLRGLFSACQTRLDDPAFDTLSMGMSSDYEIAIEEGSTRVRVGTSIFGRRER